MGFQYEGNELDFFSDVPNWRKYILKRISKVTAPTGYVVELGSGIGSNAPYLASLTSKYIGIEPDKLLVAAAKLNHSNLKFACGYSEEIAKFHFEIGMVCLIDVLEHISEDRTEILKISKYLKPGSKIVILVPAHNFLFSDLDRSVGHYRRYTKTSLKRVIPDSLEILSCEYLDTLGFILSAFSKLLGLGNSLSKLSVKIWHFLLPISIRLDSISNHLIGKSIILISEVKDLEH